MPRQLLEKGHTIVILVALGRTASLFTLRFLATGFVATTQVGYRIVKHGGCVFMFEKTTLAPAFSHKSWLPPALSCMYKSVCRGSLGLPQMPR